MRNYISCKRNYVSGLRNEVLSGERLVISWYPLKHFFQINYKQIGPASSLAGALDYRPDDTPQNVYGDWT